MFTAFCGGLYRNNITSRIQKKETQKATPKRWPFLVLEIGKMFKRLVMVFQSPKKVEKSERKRLTPLQKRVIILESREKRLRIEKQK